MMLEMTMELNRQDGGLMLERVTTITIHDEMAFWMRWGMDHIGDENPALSSTLRAFSAGAVSDEDRISRFIEDVERSEFERQMVSLGPMYMNTGLGLDSEELLGDFRAFNELKIEVDLNGQDAVINHPRPSVFPQQNWLETATESICFAISSWFNLLLSGASILSP